ILRFGASRFSRTSGGRGLSWIRRAGPGEALDPLYIGGVVANETGTVIAEAGEMGIYVGAGKFHSEFVRAGRAEHRIENHAAEHRSAMAVLEVVFHASGYVPRRWNRFGGRTGVGGEIPQSHFSLDALLSEDGNELFLPILKLGPAA